MQAHLWISLACRPNISSTGPAAGVAHHGEPLLTSPGSSWWRKLTQKLLFLNKTWAPLDLHLSKQDLKCVLVALLEYVFIRIVHRSITQLVIKNMKQKGIINEQTVTLALINQRATDSHDN